MFSSILIFIVFLFIIFSSVSKVCEVDVFAHPRFCDDFSQLVNMRLLQLQVSVEDSRRLNRCLRRCKRSH